MASVNFQNMNIYPTSGVVKTSLGKSGASKTTDQSVISSPAFKSNAYTSVATLRTSLTTKDEKKKYEALANELDLEYRKKLEFALKSGSLLKDNSNDKSSVLDNLHKIITTERDAGLDKVNILKECLDILSNPFVITQTMEDVPKEYQKQVIGLITGLSEDPKTIAQTKWELENLSSGTCPAASIEFDLATKHTAEFFRMVEGLTSPENQVVKKIKTSSLSDNTSNVIWLLSTFKTPYKMLDFDNAEVILKPDENALIRARIQNHYKDKGERSMIDVLMQSTFMQLGSQQTYNSLTDKRAPNEWTQDDGGLIEFEKTYVESVVEDKNTTSVIYQKVDENGRLIGYEKDFKTIKKELLDTLKMGNNILIGYTWPVPSDSNRLAGHEITIVGYKEHPDGEGVFICQDSDDDVTEPIEMKESFLLSHIHHAGLPEEIASRDFNYQESWEVGVDEFQENQNQNQNIKKSKDF